MKTCNKCNETKSLDSFYKKSKYRDSTCSDCRKEAKMLKRIEKTKEPIKKCSKCNRTRKMTDFYISKTHIVRSECKQCTLESKEKKVSKTLGFIENNPEELIRTAEVSLEELKQTEAWKLKNGYKWVTETINITEYTTRKQRVLRKV